MRRPTLFDEFQHLKSTVSPHRRGFEFQALIEQLFRRAHYKVEPNPGIARPRQTDLLATTDRAAYLVETKWQQRVVDVDDVDSLFSRLGTTPPNVTGVLISMNGFSRTAFSQVESHRDRPLLLVSGDELERVLEWPGDLTWLLRRKQQHLLVNGRALVATGGEPRLRRRSKSRPELPQADTVLVLPDGQRCKWLACGGGFGEFVFVLTLPDIDWVTAGGVGVSLDVSLPMMHEKDLVRLIGELSDMGWISGSSWWSIQQSNNNWYGAGSRSFCHAVTAWKDRYRGASDVHHTEQLCYQDVCEGGFYTLVAQVSAWSPRTVSHCALSFQLQGVPMDTSAWRHLCDAFEVPYPLYFRPRSEKSVTTRHLFGKERVLVRPTAFVVEEDMDSEMTDPSDREWVAGIVVPNPHRRQAETNRQAGPEWWPRSLGGSEWLVCNLRSWHPLSEPRQRYRLCSLEWAWTSDALVIEVTADWDDQIRRRSAPRSRMGGKLGQHGAAGVTDEA